MATTEVVRSLEDLARDLDLLAYRVERPAPGTTLDVRKLVRELEALRDRISDAARALDR
jgi:HAMP domain-containing protein